MTITRNGFIFFALLCAAGNSHAFSATAVCVDGSDGGTGFTSAICSTTFFQGLTTASSDLATGTLSSISVNDGVPLPNRAGGGFEDEVTIVGLAPGANASITATLHVTGTFDGESPAFLPSAVAQLIIGFPVVSMEEGAALVDLFYDGANVTADESRSIGNYSLIINSLAASAVDITLVATTTVSAIDPTFFLSADISTIAEAENSTTVVAADFGNTATLSLDLPPGLSFTSASGVLLTAPIPVPPAIWLFGSGLIGLIGIARRKKS